MSKNSTNIKRRAQTQLARNSKSAKVEKEGATTHRHIEGGHVHVTTQFHPKPPPKPAIPPLGPIPVSAADKTDVDVETEPATTEEDTETQVRTLFFQVPFGL